MLRRADNLTYLHVPTVLKCGSLNLLELSGPVQVCNGIAVPFLYTKSNMYTKDMLTHLNGCRIIKADNEIFLIERFVAVYCLHKGARTSLLIKQGKRKIIHCSREHCWPT